MRNSSICRVAGESNAMWMVSMNHHLSNAAFREPHPCRRANSCLRNRFWKPLSITNSSYRTHYPLIAETNAYSVGRGGSKPCKASISDLLSRALHDLFSLCLHLQPLTPTPPQSPHQSARHSPPPSARAPRRGNLETHWHQLSRGFQPHGSGPPATPPRWPGLIPCGRCRS